jgi:hypothetical protein
MGRVLIECMNKAAEANKRIKLFYCFVKQNDDCKQMKQHTENKEVDRIKEYKGVMQDTFRFESVRTPCSCWHHKRF